MILPSGISGIKEMTTFPDPDDPDLLACIALGNKMDAPGEEQALFDAISQRHTNRQAFEPQAIPDTILMALQRVAHIEGVWFSLMQGEEERNTVSRSDCPGGSDTVGR